MIFGTEDGTVFALNTENGKTVWTYSAAGAVKGAVAFSRGRLYFGDYGGQVHSISARDGHRYWTASPGGRFYSTGALAWGRFYVGNTDGRMYSYTTSGELAWARQTGAYVYASPAVADAGAGPTVYAGSYDGTFYAWNAKTGDTRWTYNAGGKISGGAFVIGDLVWFDDLGHERTVALSAKSGRRRFTMETGAFNPVITDGRTMYIVGYTNLYGFVPKGHR
jgi:outer membrane protein assembly factor BamB